MNSKTSKKNDKNQSFKIIIILLSFCMLGSLFYIYKMSDRSKSIIISLREQKSILLKDLEKSEMFLQQAITSNTTLSKKLIAEQLRIKQLIYELKTKKVTEKTIVVYKENANNVDNRLKLLFNEINVYKNKIDSTNVVLNQERSKIDTLNTTNKKLVKKINDATKLYFYNLQTSTFKVKNNNKIIETERASRINLIKTSFVIAENELVKKTSKRFFIQIIDSKNNVIGSKNVEKFGKEELFYTKSMQVEYAKKTMKVETEIEVSNLEKGIYFVNVFDNATLILSTTFTLL